MMSTEISYTELPDGKMIELNKELSENKNFVTTWIERNNDEAEIKMYNEAIIVKK